MGAYGGTPQASMSALPGGIIADLSFDYVVDYSDLGIFTANWLASDVPLAEDLNRDGIVDFDDFAIFAMYWGDSEDPGFTPEFREDFETGDFSQYDWQLSGDVNWMVVSNVNYEGTCAAKSGSITHTEGSIMEVTLEIKGNRISFYHKVSSEADYDYLRFYIDGVKKDQWSGEQDWALETYAIGANEHTFKWVYEKDNSGDEGSDCAWLDDIQVYFDTRE
jgi:hypothetical protein